MNRHGSCGPEEAKRRSKIARTYLDMAELAEDQGLEEARNVAAGNAVLAAIAACDALCCLRLGKLSRGQSHAEAVALLRTVHPDGRELSADLAKVLGVKDTSHYGTAFVAAAKLKTTMRSATTLVEAAEAAVERG